MVVKLREEHRLKVFENKILRQIFESKRVENEEWRKHQNKEFCHLYQLPNIAKVVKYTRLRWVSHVARIENSGNAFIILTGKFPNKMLS